MKLLTRSIRILLTAGLCAISLSALAQSQALVADVGFVSLGDLPPGTSHISAIRLQALRETATQLGARGALAWRSIQIDHTLQADANYLNNVFNFNQLLINGNVLPPVLTQADNSMNLSSEDSIRTASKIYEIVSPARFVSVAPNWRTYLWMSFKKPDLPNHTLMPTTQAEVQVWNAYMRQGWKEGLTQANQIFAVNLHRIERDYRGMVLYRELLSQHMVSAPFIAKTNLGVTGNSHEIRINDRVQRITAHSQLQPDSREWKPILTP